MSSRASRLSGKISYGEQDVRARHTSQVHEGMIIDMYKLLSQASGVLSSGGLYFKRKVPINQSA